MTEHYVKCKVDDCCENSHYTASGSRGWCSAHYQRWKRHGDPLRGGTSRGALIKWIEDHLSYDGDDCLIWPYGFDAHGYCIVRIEGKYVYAHRFICQETHGEPPAIDSEAAHSCGNGHLGCLNPKHIRWTNHSGNMLDRYYHGWSNRGEDHVSSLISNSQAVEIHKLAHDGKLSQRAIAELYGISQPHVSDIKTGRTWGHVTGQSAS